MKTFGLTRAEISHLQKDIFAGREVEKEQQAMVKLALRLQQLGIHRGNLPLHPSKELIDDGRQSGIIRRRTGSATVVEINRHAAEWWLNFDFVSSHALALVSSVSEKVNQKITDFDYSQSLIQQVLKIRLAFPIWKHPGCRKS